MNNDNNNNDLNTTNNNNNWKWILHGNIVIPTGNPFDINTEYGISNDNVLWLGRGLKILLDHIIVIDKIGIIQFIIPSKQFYLNYPQYGNNNNIDSNTTTVTDQLDHHHNTTTTIGEGPSIIQYDLRTEFICPGFIDLHIHAPQFSFTGTATDRQLMGEDGWLETYTFPSEQRLNDDHILAKTIYSDVVKSTLLCGTTTAVYYGTLHIQPNLILVDCCNQYKQRAFIGKVCMDRNSPISYCHTKEQNIQETIELIHYIHNKFGSYQPNTSDQGITSNTTLLPLIQPIITPRFIPTCTPELLKSLSEVALKYDCYITSHGSESIDEVQYTKFLDSTIDHSVNNIDTLSNDIERTDSVIFDVHNLLRTNQCIMAHCLYLNDYDIELFQRKRIGIAHCPLSNFFFAGQSLNCKKLLQNNVLIGLGTDVAGGYSPSMLTSMRMAVIASQSLSHQQLQSSLVYQKSIIEDTNETEKRNDTLLLSNTNQQQIQPIHQPHNDNDDDEIVSSDVDVTNTIITKNNDCAIIDYRHAFYLATLGGAYCLNLHNKIGTLQIGMEFDSIILSSSNNTTKSSTTMVHIYNHDTISDIFQKLCVLGDDRNIKQVFVQGHDVTIH